MYKHILCPYESAVSFEMNGNCVMGQEVYVYLRVSTDSLLMAKDFQHGTRGGAQISSIKQ